MKKIVLFFLSFLLVVPAVEAQPTKKKSAKKQNYAQNYPNFTGYNDNSGQDAARRRAQIRTYDSTYTFVTRHRYGGWTRPMNEGTEGIMGQDQIRLNERGEYRNLNSNTGVPLPPNNGR